jgi:Ca-activated chloride channel family protein
MSFLYPNAVIPIAVVFLIILSAQFLYEKKYFSWVKLYWFHNRTFLSRFSSFSFIIAVLLLLISMLDLRGPEEKISTDVPDQKTIILIDASSSMLVEDVRPNRYERALFLARHFIRNAVGHQVAVILFSDTTKRLVSFTDDLDLLDARISGLEDVDLSSAGSNISISLRESVNYFREQQSEGKEVTGNILLFTDGEETSEGVEKSLPSGIALAVVGIGTSKGGPIPIRSKNGSFRGYKKFDGEKVISQLDESWLKSFGQSHDLYKYWVAMSYNVPTDDVLSFYEKVFDKRLSKGEMRYRPVLGLPFIIGFFIFISLYSILGLFSTFHTEKAKNVAKSLLVVLGVVILSLFDTKSYAQDEKKEVDLSEASVSLLKEMEKGKGVRRLKIKLGESLFAEGQNEMALKIYKEVIDNESIDQERAAYLNYLSLMLMSAHKQKAAELIHQQQGALTSADREKLRENIVYILKEQQEKGKSSESESESESDQSDEKKEERSSEGKGESREDKGQESKPGPSSDKQENNKKEESEEEEGDEKQKESKPEDGKEATETEEKNKEEVRPQTWQEKVEQIKSKQKLRKELPAVLQQIQGQDRDLQKEQLDTRTNQRSSGQKKDW